MSAGLLVNFSRSVKYIAALLSLICLGNFTAGAQSRGFSAAVSGGYSQVYNKDNNFPFSEAGNGYFVQLSGMLSLGTNWGGIVSVQHNYLSLNTGKAEDIFLNNDPNATAITIKSGRFTMTNIGAGVYYDWKPANNFFIRVAPVIGYSYLLTPKIGVAVATEPTTIYRYNKGGSPALFYSLNINPALRISQRCNIHLAMGYSYASYKIASEFSNARSNNKVSYGKLNLGVGFEYSFSKTHK